MDPLGAPLLGRSAVITGANQGLGRAIAERFVRAGASVLLTARGEGLLHTAAAELAALATHPGQRVLARVADVSDARACDATAAQAVAELDNPCVLVNNAGVYGPFGPIEENDWAEWVRAIEINLSGGGATAPLPRVSSYAASKAAVVRFTETLAEEARDAGIDVNAIAPGALNTRLMDDLIAAGPEKVGTAFFERMTRTRDSGGTPLEKGADLTVFLASAASDGITGRLISAVWDDWADLSDRRDQLAASDIYTLRRITPDDRGGWKKAA
jgi:3-oxoacyl-[acyl-carrier protein] reductase